MRQHIDSTRATILVWRVMAEYGAICPQIKEKIADLPYFARRDTTRCGAGNSRGPRSAKSGHSPRSRGRAGEITGSAKNHSVWRIFTSVVPKLRGWLTAEHVFSATRELI